MLRIRSGLAYPVSSTSAPLCDEESNARSRLGNTLVIRSLRRLIIRTRSAIRSARCPVSTARLRTRSVSVSMIARSRRSRAVSAMTLASLASVLPSPTYAGAHRRDYTSRRVTHRLAGLGQQREQQRRRRADDVDRPGQLLGQRGHRGDEAEDSSLVVGDLD